jgi:uncharacterized protein (TIGR03067 family)
MKTPVRQAAMLIGLLGFACFASAGDSKALQGKWVVVSHFEDGKEEPKQKGDVYIFEKDRLILQPRSGKGFTFTIKADPAKKTIDIIVDASEQLKGLYQVDGKTLKLCLADRPEDARPTELKAAKGVVFTVLERQP